MARSVVSDLDLMHTNRTTGRLRRLIVAPSSECRSLQATDDSHSIGVATAAVENIFVNAMLRLATLRRRPSVSPSFYMRMAAAVARLCPS